MSERMKGPPVHTVLVCANFQELYQLVKTTETKLCNQMRELRNHAKGTWETTQATRTVTTGLWGEVPQRCLKSLHLTNSSSRSTKLEERFFLALIETRKNVNNKLLTWKNHWKWTALKLSLLLNSHKRYLTGMPKYYKLRTERLPIHTSRITIWNSNGLILKPLQNSYITKSIG